MIALAFVILAGAGALSRWGAAHLNRPSWPWGTLAVNVLGAFALGLLADAGGTTHTLLGTAFLGSLTTWSSVVAEVAALAPRRSALYLTATLLLGIAAAAAGLAVSLG